MFDHVGVQAVDTDAAATAYLAALAPVGLTEMVRFPTPGGPVVGFGDLGPDRPAAPYFWVSPGGVEARAHESHIAFGAASREQVDAVHAAVLAAGLEVLHAPRVWPEYHPGYYAVFFRDLDGNNVEAVTHLAP